MEKRIILAFLISLVVVTGWQVIFPPPPPAEVEESADPATAGDPASTGTPTTGAPATAGPGTAAPGTPSNSGPGTAPSGPRRSAPLPEGVDADESLVLSDDNLHLAFSRRGAALRIGKLMTERAEVDSPEGVEGAFTLVHDYEMGPKALALFSDQAGRRQEGWLDAVVWDSAGPSADGRSLTFTLDVTEGETSYRLTKTFALIDDAPGRLRIDVGLEHTGGGGDLNRLYYLANSSGVFPQRLVGAQISRPHGLVGIPDGDDIELRQWTLDDLQEEGPNGKRESQARFACDMGLFFASYIRHVEGGQSYGADFLALDPYSEDKDPTDEELARQGPARTLSFMFFELKTSAGSPKQTATFDYYLGPKDHRRIKEAFPEGKARDDYLAAADFELTETGFCCAPGPVKALISLISKAVIAALDLFYGFFGNMGVAIILLTLCVRLLMFPITRRSQVAMTRHTKNMKRVKPKLDALKEKYGNDKNLFAQKQMELMKEEKVQLVPVGGCLPMFLQIPIFFGLFSAIRFDYDLRHSAFLWCEDLSVPDRLIALKEPFVFDDCCIPMPPISIDGLNVFPLLMIAAMFVHQLGMPKSDDPQFAQQQQMMKFMPIFFGFLMYGYAAGLSLYWLSSSLFGIFEQRVIKKIWPID